MITKAKVSLSAVKAFDQTVAEAGGFSPKFERGISCMERFAQSFTELEHTVQEKIKGMQTARRNLATKIQSIQRVISELSVKIQELQRKMADMESKLHSMSPTITTKDEKGKTHEIPNPAYVALKAQISAIQSEITAVRTELNTHRQRLDKAHSIDSRLSALMDHANSTIYSLNEKRNTSKQFIQKLNNIKSSNQKKCTIAVENLKKINQLVAAYMRIKINYDSAIPQLDITTPSRRNEININVNIHNNMVVNELQNTQIPMSEEEMEKHPIPMSEEEMEKHPVPMRQEEMEKHPILLDSDNHICEFEGKKYGGRFNTYKERIDSTSREDPILGRYVGERGESKYIPSNRSAEGIVVNGILKKYKLDGITYRNGEPDFEVCAEAVVRIKGMTAIRYNYTDENELSQLGNFSQADIELARLWNFDEKKGRTDWTAREVLEYRKANGLTWHEKCDMETMVLVKTEINAYFKHIGGCSECRLRDADNDEGGFYEQ